MCSKCGTFVQGECAFIGFARRNYPDEQVNTWIIAQLMDLYKFAGVKEKPTFQQFWSFPWWYVWNTITWKLPNCCFFSSSLKTGEYGTFYGVVDPMVIMSALIEFKAYRKKATGEIRPGRTGKTTRKKIREARQELRTISGSFGVSEKDYGIRIIKLRKWKQ